MTLHLSLCQSDSCLNQRLLTYVVLHITHSHPWSYYFEGISVVILTISVTQWTPKPISVRVWTTEHFTQSNVTKDDTILIPTEKGGYIWQKWNLACKLVEAAEEVAIVISGKSAIWDCVVCLTVPDEYNLNGTLICRRWKSCSVKAVYIAKKRSEKPDCGNDTKSYL